MATINWSFADLLDGDEEDRRVTTDMVMNALDASPENRDVRVHDGYAPDKYCKQYVAENFWQNLSKQQRNTHLR